MRRRRYRWFHGGLWIQMCERELRPMFALKQIGRMSTEVLAAVFASWRPTGAGALAANPNQALDGRAESVTN